MSMSWPVCAHIPSCRRLLVVIVWLLNSLILAAMDTQRDAEASGVMLEKSRNCEFPILVVRIDTYCRSSDGKVLYDTVLYCLTLREEL